MDDPNSELLECHTVTMARELRQQNIDVAAMSKTWRTGDRQNFELPIACSPGGEIGGYTLF